MTVPRPVPAALTRTSTRYPLPLIALAVGMLISYLPELVPGSIGSSLSFLGWAVPLLGSSLFLFRSTRPIRFPLALWAPWASYVIAYLFVAEANHALQRSVMLLTPVVVGAAFSKVRFDKGLVDTCRAWLGRFFWIFLVAAGLMTGLLAAGKLYSAAGFASGSITASLLAAWFAACYATEGRVRTLICWAALAAVPVLANTRTGMAAVALTLPLTFVPWPGKKRVAALAMIAISGFFVFQSARIQSKMFFSGHGSIQEAAQGVASMLAGDEAANDDFATSGRIVINQVLVPRIEEAYWFGHGANTTEAISLAIADLPHPHNDWLRLRYEYGTVGMLAFFFTLIAQMIHGLRLARRLRIDLAVFLYAGAGAFLPMALFMFSDNVILYAAWFGNLQFAMLGLGYAALTSELNSRSTRRGANLESTARP